MKPSCMSGTRLYEIWRGMKKRCVCLTDKEYQQKHAEIVEMYSECGRIETHVYVKDKKE